MIKRLAWSLCLICWSAGTVQAGPMGDAVPETLRQWTDWVLHGSENYRCAFVQNNVNERRCAWPSRLMLNLDDQGGQFSASWHTDIEAWGKLPGDASHWPQQVTVDGKPAVLSVREQVPAIRLSPGGHQIMGRFVWQHLPENLTVARESGLISLTVKGRQIVTPMFNEQGQLWIEGAVQGGGARPEFSDRLQIQVFRRVVDEVPLQVVTLLELDVSGAKREVLLAGALLADFIPLQLDSPLPARLEPDGRLRAQLRPGHWQVTLSARHPVPVDQLKLPGNSVAPWPAQEIWSFEAKPQLRMVDIEGVAAVDPRQTQMPEDWKRLPAYRMQGEEKMMFRLLRRGDPEPEPDTLSLNREMWLDFDGGGYTLNDQITGRMTRNWRLNVQQGVELGRVTLDDQPQLITRLQDGAPAGVEMRRGEVNLRADSRYQKAGAVLPASGWDQDFQSVSAQLHLSPGWRLFAATGVDQAQDTWVGRWTLLDLFLVMIAVLAVAHLWGWPKAWVSLAALALLWHEPGAPRYIWLNLLTALALLRVLPDGRFAGMVRVYRNLVLLGLLLVGIPFMVAQIRLGLYPQLEMPWQMPTPTPQQAKPASVATADMAEAEPEAEAKMMEAAPSSMDKYGYSGTRRLMRFADPWADPWSGGSEGITQTGPGLPQWQWHDVRLSWNGPVLKTQALGLYLISPTLSMWLNFLRVMLMLALAWLMLNGDRFGTQGRGGAGQPVNAATAVVPAEGGTAARRGLAMMLLLLMAGSQQAKAADFPDQKILDEYKTRLLEPPECVPACGQIPLLRLILSTNALRLQLEVHALTDVAIPLPAQEGHWLPTEVGVDGKAAEGLSRDAQGILWLRLSSGRHEVTLTGPLPQREQVPLPLPLPPRRVESEGSGWVVEGIGENGVPEAQLQLTRIQDMGRTGAEGLEPRPLPAFMQVQRTLHLGLDWRADTQVQRLGTLDIPVVAEIPLLPGELVTTPGLTVRNGRLLVNLLPGQQGMGWTSVMDKAPSIQLSAAQTSDWVEIWEVDVSPLWHLQSEGIAVVHHQSGEGRWLPQWRPWAGESVKLTLIRPQGIAGNTLTLESSRVHYSLGLRASEATLDLSLRSAQGAQHNLMLPEGAVLQSASIDGQPQPIRQQGETVTLPIRPGLQSVSLRWREEAGSSARFTMPGVSLGAPSVNANASVTLGEDRWVLLVGGPKLGPAVLFWGLLAVIVLIAFALSRIPLTPLGFTQWTLLGVGLSQIPLAGAACVAGWLLALGWRGKRGASLDDSRFNVLQMALPLLTLLAAIFLFMAVQQGLLGLPDMHVAGGNSSAYRLHWYQDRSGPTLPRPWVVSAPIWLYRVLMLAWALWLAYALLNWLRWGWGCYAQDGLWRARKKAPSESAEPPQAG